jgi:hypothetical protein
MIEEATSDGHSGPDGDELLQEEPQPQHWQLAATLVKEARPHPLSEQLLASGRSWPRHAHDDDKGQYILFHFIVPYFVLTFHCL